MSNRSHRPDVFGEERKTEDIEVRLVFQDDLVKLICIYRTRSLFVSEEPVPCLCLKNPSLVCVYEILTLFVFIKAAPCRSGRDLRNGQGFPLLKFNMYTYS